MPMWIPKLYFLNSGFTVISSVISRVMSAIAESDESIREQFLPTLESMYPGFRDDQVVAFRVSRVRQVLALSTLNYSDALPPMRTSVPGLYLVNSAHIVNGTLNVNETIQLAERAVPVLTESP